MSLKFEKNYKNTETQPQLSGSYIKKFILLITPLYYFSGLF